MLKLRSGLDKVLSDLEKRKETIDKKEEEILAILCVADYLLYKIAYEDLTPQRRQELIDSVEERCQKAEKLIGGSKKMVKVKVLECVHCGSVLYPTGNCSGCGTSTGEAKAVEIVCKGDCANCIASIDCDREPEPQYECGIWLCGQVGGDCSYCPSRF